MFSICRIKNISGAGVTIRGKTFAIDEIYTLPDNLRISWANDSGVILAITGELIQIGDDVMFFESFSDQVNYLKQNKLQSEVISTIPFASNILPDGTKIYSRLHGLVANLVANGEATVDFTVPYDVCKINGAELLYCPEGVKVDFKVMAGETQLNQFGFDVNVAKDFFCYKSRYEANLLKNLTLRAVLKNSTDSTKTVGINYLLHEVKA